MDNPTEPDQPPLFRPSKKRKIYRQRATSPPTTIENLATEDTTTSLSAAVPPQPLTSGAAADDEDTAPSTAAIRRLLASRRQRGGGVEFRASNPRGTDDAEDVDGENAIVVVRRESHDDGHAEEGGLAMGGKRFVTQTGMSAEGVDRHMMAYIDSELAKRHHHQPTSTSTSTHATTTTAAEDSAAAASSQSQRQRQPSPPYQTASRGKLMEIELPPSSSTTAPPVAKAIRKPRLGRDGKPIRGKKRRTEEDIRRDALVEAVMQENSLGIYESPAPPTTSGAGGDGEGDEEIAERFRREFLEGVEERRRGGGGGGGGQAKKVVGKGGKEEEGLKGPKLGGSRSARAGVREALLKAERGKR
ncbi:hypothetical protein VE01_06535 [Pseudogymnoascus verrucosus]|uniref:mRNA splicing factor RNA helicase n=1 Tax=Pseudogymnoascus verrucosus TaxID=342668 RepID=A0A1B8GIN6_9PEZI|nr:uncharacterized protein VE01_06535 [Pseudogymnoascus verrucosus]OBT95700.1 hypothetical protein VE01_06535 [Pseudogymnoascus verrucosus]